MTEGIAEEVNRIFSKLLQDKNGKNEFHLHYQMTTEIVMVVVTEEIGDNRRLIVVGETNQTHLNGYMAEVVVCIIS